jgi:hypothetical protein
MRAVLCLPDHQEPASDRGAALFQIRRASSELVAANSSNGDNIRPVLESALQPPEAFGRSKSELTPLITVAEV